MTGTSQQADIVITAQIELLKASKNYKKVLDKSIPKEGTQRMAALRESISSVNIAKQKLDKALGKQSPFQGWALSIMFAGMAVKNAMQSIWSSSTKTFNDVMHSVEGTVTGFDLLDGSIKYLGFTIGQALEPLAALFVPIIDYVQQLIMNNPDTTKGIFALLAVLSTAAAVGGGLVLAKSGFSQLFDIVGKLIKVDINGWLSGINMMAATVAIGFTLDAISDAQSKDWWGASASAFEAIGLFAIAGGKGKMGAALLSVGLALDVVGTLVNGGALTRQSMADLFTKAGAGFLFVNPGTGAALLTFGIIANVMGDDKWYQFVANLGILFGLMFTGVAAVIDAMLAPIVTIINALIMAWNFIKRDNMDLVSYTSLTDKAWSRVQDLVAVSNEFSNPTTPTTAENTLPANAKTGDVINHIQVSIGQVNDWDDFMRQLNASKS